MKKVIFDFRTIGEIGDFYSQLKEKLSLPAFFGENLDALYDIITGELELPLEIEFVNMTKEQLRRYDLLIGTLQDAMLDSEGFSFGYVVEK